MSQPSRLGTIQWVDLTVPDAEKVRDFYQAVVGWTPAPVDMGSHQDFNMISPGTGRPAAGICHARGVNAALPPQWLIYVPVPDLAASLANVERLGGRLLHRHNENCCLIQDPAGAVMMIYQE